MMAARVLIAVPDLLFRSKLRDAARDRSIEGHAPARLAARRGHRRRAAIDRREVHLEASAGVVLERARETRPDIVVVDLGDERIEPFDLIRKLKAEPSLSSTRVVGFFSHVRLDIRDAAKAAGCDVILPRSAIVSALSGLISGNATGRQDEP